jgi:hypothetical protein
MQKHDLTLGGASCLGVRQRQPLQLINFGSVEFFFASNKRCLSKNKSGNLICRGGFLLFLNFSELSKQLAPPSGESGFSINNYLFMGHVTKKTTFQPPFVVTFAQLYCIVLS